MTTQRSDARTIFARIEREFEHNRGAFDRMDNDWERYTLAQWQPGDEEPISPEDAYTTNKPRVLANKIIALLSGTVAQISCRNDFAEKPQEDINDTTERLAVGFLDAANRRLAQRGEQGIQEQLASFSTIRGRYAALRGMLVKNADGSTRVDVLPLDPRHLVIWMGADGPAATAYEMFRTRREVADTYKGFKFRDQDGFTREMWDEPVEVYEYIEKRENRDYDPESLNPFARRRHVYVAGTIVDSRWAIRPHDTFTRTCPVYFYPVDQVPMISPTNREKQPTEHFGESIFAEDRDVWDKYNRMMSYGMDMMAKASNPRQIMRSLDGTVELEDGSLVKGSIVNLSTANQEDLAVMQEADIKGVHQFIASLISTDEVGGSLPPQAIGLLDKPLSSVALRQLGQNLEQKALPRMTAIANTLRMCLAGLVDQYETGAFEPVPVSGNVYGSRYFANQTILPEQIAGHDPIMVKMQLSLPEDNSLNFDLAIRAMQPTPDGEPLMPIEWIREHIIKADSPRQMSRMNQEMMARRASPIIQLKDLLEAAIRDGDEAKSMALYDQLRIAVLQQTVQGSMMMLQMQQLLQGIPVQTAVQPGYSDAVVQQAGQNGQNSRMLGNPANGATPAVQFQSVGNEPSPDAGFNTTASRSRRPTGLVGPDGSEIFATE